MSDLAVCMQPMLYGTYQSNQYVFNCELPRFEMLNFVRMQKSLKFNEIQNN